MKPQPVSVLSYPHAVIHIDGDSFFASCEVARNPSLRGKPVVTGQERGIVSSMTYEAKSLGISRAMKIKDIKKLFPQVIVISSDYESYSLYSVRMYSIVKRYTPQVEEYSIDECYADLTGLRRVFRMSYEQIAEKIRKELEAELGMSFSIGLGPNKTIAKLASKYKKPSGFTPIPARKIHTFIHDMPIGKICGIGPNTEGFLQKKGIYTVLQFAEMKREWIEDNVSKPFKEIWAELHGFFIRPLELHVAHRYKSIMKVHTFVPSLDPTFIFAELSKNVEYLAGRLRRYGLGLTALSFYLKTNEFDYQSAEMVFEYPTAIAEDVLRRIRPLFDKMLIPKMQYRATSVSMYGLRETSVSQLDLFGAETTRKEKLQEVYKQVDKVGDKYGRHTVFLGTSFPILNRKKGEQKFRERNIGIPFLGNAN